jgi:glycosyltransferase involved in cell wall biosynthesis
VIRLRIVFVLPHAGMSGGIRVVAIYSQLLKKRGHDVAVVSTPINVPLRTRIKRLFRGERCWGKAAAGPSHFDGVDVEHHCIDRQRPVVDRDIPDADVVVATWWETAEWVSRLSPRKGAKAYFIQHYEDWGGDPRRVDATWRLPMHKIVISRWLERMGRERFGITGMSLVPNAVDLRQFGGPARGKAPVPTVGFMYSTTPFKGCDVAIEAIALARSRLSSLAVKSFGVMSPIRAMPLPRKTEFTRFPEQPRLRDIYAGCDAWLFPSRTEGFGLPLLEAMACRTPVIAAPAGAAPELVPEGGGVLLEASDPVLMADAIVRLCQLPEPEWRKRSTAAREVATRHTWEDSAKLFEAALELAIARGREQRASSPTEPRPGAPVSGAQT